MSPGSSQRRASLVGSVAERLREKVFRCAPDERVGSLTELAAGFGVGIVTVQQAARILEHEGLLVVRRGPGGGYFGRRPDERTLEQALAAYLRMHPDSIDEALDMTSLLFIELCGAAALAVAPQWRGELDALAHGFRPGLAAPEVEALERGLQDLLFRMVERPIFELLTRVTLHFAARGGMARVVGQPGALTEWAAGRRRIIAAIAAGDPSLARFEADRSNRQPVLRAIRAARDPV